MQLSGVESAIRELQGEVKKIQKVISMLSRIRTQRAVVSAGKGRARRRLSAKARRLISQAAKKRWAARKAGFAKGR